MPRSPERVVMIHGAPRSGTSWLGQIVNSSPRVAYRFQPLFSYAFKDRLGPDSGREEIERFLDDLSASDDDFLLQRDQVARGAYPVFLKDPVPTHLAMKHVRYHHVLENLIRRIPDRVRVVGIVRHPCAVLSSWLKAPKEFHPGWDPAAEWRRAPSKNLGRPEEYYGFEKWKEVAELFLRLAGRYPDHFLLVRYAALNRDPAAGTARLFDFCGLDVEPQTTAFLEESRSRTHPDANAVFRENNDDGKWRGDLDPAIAAEVMEELAGTPLETFLEEAGA